jgi:threonine/homoserine efflux transporter RhtA
MSASTRLLCRQLGRRYSSVAKASVNPVFAALTGLMVLGQSLAFADWLAIAAIVSANGVSLSIGGRA